MSRKINGMPKEKLFKDTMRMVNADSIALKKTQKQQGQAILELSNNVIDKEVDIISLQSANWYLRRDINRLKKQNYDLQKWLEGYIILLFAIVVVFIIVVFVS